MVHTSYSNTSHILQAVWHTSGQKITKVPIGLYVGEADVTCPPTTAIEIRDTIGDMVKDFVIYPGATHETFGTKTDKEFADRIAKLLGYQTTDDPMYIQWEQSELQINHNNLQP